MKLASNILKKQETTKILMRKAFSTYLTCSGCGERADGAGGLFFACPNASDDKYKDIDHVFAPEDPSLNHLQTLAKLNDASNELATSSNNPFIRYRSLLFPYRVAMDKGMSDTEYVDLVHQLDESIKDIGGVGFIETPLMWCKDINAFVKNETNNVAQSHKARHLFNLMTYLLVMAKFDTNDTIRKKRLAVASCGNAGLAAALVAAAAKWPIDVCIPPDADPSVVTQLEKVGADVHICSRDDSHVDTKLGTISTKGSADPTVAVFRNLVQDHSSIPFSVQGCDCGMAVEGSQTIAWEVIEAIHRDYSDDLNSKSKKEIEEIHIQVGGGALGSGLIQGFQRAIDGHLAVINPSFNMKSLPKLFCVQPDGNGPLNRAYTKMLSDNILLSEAVKHRSKYMYAWENPHSIAHGILDDETYDWVALVNGMSTSNGGSILIDDENICKAKEFAESTFDLNPCHTGSAGLAALINKQTNQTSDEIEHGPVNLIILSGLDRS